MLDKLAKGKSEIEIAEDLFTKIRNEFEETTKAERKVKQLRTIEQGERLCNEYVQEFKKVTRESSYKGKPLIKK